MWHTDVWRLGRGHWSALVGPHRPLQSVHPTGSQSWGVKSSTVSSIWVLGPWGKPGQIALVNLSLPPGPQVGAQLWREARWGFPTLWAGALSLSQAPLHTPQMTQATVHLSIPKCQVQQHQLLSITLSHPIWS